MRRILGDDAIVNLSDEDEREVSVEPQAVDDRSNRPSPDRGDIR